MGYLAGVAGLTEGRKYDRARSYCEGKNPEGQIPPGQFTWGGTGVFLRG